VKRIPLTQGKFALVDDGDFNKISRYAWYAMKTRNNYYAVTGQCDTRLMHRKIMSPPKGMVVDHINHNTLDNRRVNLRICAQGQNATHSVSGFKGVYVHSRGYGFVAQMKVKGRLIYLGKFTDARDAAVAYNQAVKKYHGEYALLNKI
jgi:hypothetical protein